MKGSRSVQNFKRRHLFKLFSLFQSHRTLHAATVTDYLQVTSDDLERRFKDNFLSSKIVNLYSQHGDVSLAWWTFHHLPNKDVYTWNSMAFAYVSHGRFREALGCFNQFFTTSGLRPDFYTFPPVVKACRDLLDGKKDTLLGFEIRDRGSWNAMISGYCQNGNAAEALDVADEMRLEGHGLEFELFVSNALINMYAKFGSLGQAQKVFWSDGEHKEITPNQGTWVSILPAYSHVGALQQGMRIHGRVIKNCLCSDVFVGTCLIDMYGKCGKVDDAISLFYQVPRKSSVPWNAMMSCYGVQGDARDRGLRKNPGWSSITLNNKVDVFYTGNQTHPRCVEIYRELRGLTAKIKTIGYVPDFSFVLQDVEEDEKEHILMGHSERLAIAYGMISTSPKTPIRIFKNMRVCGDCHTVTKFISIITEREIIVRDSNRFHHFKGGTCSCGDYW
ncbi:hypothetical protein OIU85_002889 [Salix viminalis]|uniref:DYW domain-containing protein n=1 Tax=Salix viminalis TaxID=40686 RepID=A0A9Q0ZZP6_SALVM|nr:hypothetical protein OIU85_002889 [Salix viminalis]